MSKQDNNSNNSSIKKTGPVSKRSIAQAAKRAENENMSRNRKSVSNSADQTSMSKKDAQLNATTPIRTRKRSATSAHASESSTTSTKIPSRKQLKQESKVAQSVNKSESNEQATKVIPTSASNANAGQDKTKPVPKRVEQSNNDDKKAKKMNKKDKKKNKKSASRSFMITLMVTYVLVVGAIGIWGVSQFFWFYVQEKSPVMAAGTENSRVENTPEIEESKVAAAKEQIMGAGISLKDVTIRQVGPTIHFYIIGHDNLDRDAGRLVGQQVISVFADALENPTMFATYEAQIIVTKDNLEALPPEVMLRPAADDGNEQQFPQFGVSNKNVNGAERAISWSRNGE